MANQAPLDYDSVCRIVGSLVLGYEHALKEPGTSPFVRHLEGLLERATKENEELRRRLAAAGGDARGAG